MYEENTVAVVVPALNAAGFVGEVIDTIPSFVDRVYPVDDCSTDGTWAEIRAHARRANEEAARSGPVADGAGGLQSPAENGADGLRAPAENGASGLVSPINASGSDDSADSVDGRSSDISFDSPRVVPLRHDENRGVGAAIKTGYRRAREDGIDAVAVMAGDGQMDPDQLPRILDPVVTDLADYAKGDRLAVEEYTDEMSNWRLFCNAVLTLLTRAASGYWAMTDPQNGYTAISGEALGRLDLDSVFEDYGFATAMLVHLNVADMRVADVPMPARYDAEESGIRYTTFVPQLSALFAKGFAWRLAEKHLRRESRLFLSLYALGAAGTVAGAYATIRETLHRGGSESNTRTSKESVTNAKEFEIRGRTNMNTSQTERPRGRGPLTTLIGLMTTGLAVVFDAAQNEPLHVTVDSEDGPPESEDQTRHAGDGEEGSDR
jgi:glycosyltransferase involved in cell wall biosynthesis